MDLGTVEPRIHLFYYNKIFQQIQEKQREHLRHSENPNFETFRKDGHRQMMKIRPTNI